METLPFTRAEVDAANEEWGFNCGPGSLCALLGRTPTEIRADLCDFEDRGYTNPTLMQDILRGLGLSFRQTYRSDHPAEANTVWLPDCGLVRVQWAGPWTRPGVPPHVRFRHTHWIAARRGMIYDVNGDEWMTPDVWKLEIVPRLLREFSPRSEGVWWPTHTYEVVCP